MFKTLWIAFAISLLSLQAACSFGDGTVEGCATVMTGTFEGDAEGRVFGFFNEESKLEITLYIPNDTEEGQPRSKTLLVDESGAVTAEVPTGVLQITDSQIDLDTCEVTGTWTEMFTGTGTFRIGPYDPL